MNGWDQTAVDKWYEENLARKVPKSKLDDVIQQQQADYLIRQGVSASEITTDPIKLRSQVQEVTAGKYKPKLTTEEEKRKVKFEDLVSSFNLLEKNLLEAEQRGPITGRLGLLAAGITGGKQFPEIADFEALRKGLIGPVARAISGEVGVLTDRDIARAEGLLPKITDDPGLARRKIENVRSLIAEKLGKTEEKKGEKGEIVAPEAAQVGAEPSWAKALPFLGYAAGAATGLPALGAAGGVMAGMKTQRFLRGEQPTGIEKLFAGVPIVPATGGEAMAGGGAALMDLLFRIPRFIKAGGPKGLAGRAREKAATEVKGTIDATKIAKAGENFLKKHPEADTSVTRKIISSLKKEKVLTVPDALERTQVWNQAYTSLGRVGKSIKAGVYDQLAKATKSEIAEIAPEVAKQTARLRFLYQAPKTASKVAWQALKISALGKMLGLGGGFGGGY